MALNSESFAPISFDGGTAAIPTPTSTVTPVMGGIGAGNIGRAASRGTVASIIGYVAPQKNVIKKVALNIAEARKSWKDNKNEAWAEQSPITVEAPRGGNRDVIYKSAFNELVFKTYMAKFNPSELDRVKAIPAYKVDMTEGKVERYIVKAEDNSALQELESNFGTVTVESKGLAVLTAKELIDFVGYVTEQAIPVKIYKRDASGKVVYDAAGREEMVKLGNIGLSTKNVKLKRKEGTIEETRVILRIYDNEGKQKSIRDLSIFNNTSEYAKVPYAVLRNMTKASSFGAIDPKNILNLERFNQYFPTQDATSLPERLKIVKADYDNDEKATKEAKKAQFLDSDKSRAAELFGIDDDVWNRIASFKTTKGGRSHSMDEINKETADVLMAIRSKKAFNR